MKMIDNKRKEEKILWIEKNVVIWRLCFAPKMVEKNRRNGRVVEGARLESAYTPKGYQGFESLFLRKNIKMLKNRILKLKLNINKLKLNYYY